MDFTTGEGFAELRMMKAQKAKEFELKLSDRPVNVEPNLCFAMKYQPGL